MNPLLKMAADALAEHERHEAEAVKKQVAELAEHAQKYAAEQFGGEFAAELRWSPAEVGDNNVIRTCATITDNGQSTASLVYAVDEDGAQLLELITRPKNSHDGHTTSTPVWSLVDLAEALKAAGVEL